MKKSILVLAMILLATGPAFAAAFAPAPAKAANGAVINANGAAGVTGFFKFSKNVYVSGFLSDVGTGYTIVTGHVQGSKYYGTGYDATAIFVKDAGGNVGTTLPTPSTSVTEDAFTLADKWTKL